VAEVAGFVGRERELARLGAALGGDTRMVLVVGDAGVGKTRFAGEGMRQAAADGLVPVWGRCLPLAEKLPLLPVGDALGEVSWPGPPGDTPCSLRTGAAAGGGFFVAADLPAKPEIA
jgi:hypothetical protein